jgi:hypothetical protein
VLAIFLIWVFVAFGFIGLGDIPYHKNLLAVDGLLVAVLIS